MAHQEVQIFSHQAAESSNFILQVVSIANDGIASMAKLMKSNGLYHQWCFMTSFLGDVEQ